MQPIVVPAPRRLASIGTQDIDPADLHELAEQLSDLPVAAVTVTPHPWWDDDRCGYCPEPADALGAPRHAAAYVAYRRADDTERIYRDPVCPGCLTTALVQNRQHPAVWIEIPTAVCMCDPTRGGSCATCDGTTVDAALTGESA